MLGGAAARVADDATAYGWRDRPLLAWIIADYGEADGDVLRRCTEWASGFRAALAEHGDGAFISFMADTGPDAVVQAYPPATLERLRQVKRRYDPDNFFRANHNIVPAEG